MRDTEAMHARVGPQPFLSPVNSAVKARLQARRRPPGAAALMAEATAHSLWKNRIQSVRAPGKRRQAAWAPLTRGAFSSLGTLPAPSSQVGCLEIGLWRHLRCRNGVRLQD